jgi:hypothetical protein
VINEYNGFRKVEVQLVDWRPATSMAMLPCASGCGPIPSAQS